MSKFVINSLALSTPFSRPCYDRPIWARSLKRSQRPEKILFDLKVFIYMKLG